MHDYFLMIIAAIFVNNIVLAQYLGNCPFLGCSKDLGVSMGMGMAVIFVTVMATAFTWLIQAFFLVPMGLEYLQDHNLHPGHRLPGAVRGNVPQKGHPAAVPVAGHFSTLITTNCAVLGIAIMVQRKEYTFMESVIFATASGVGFLLALMLMAGIRERFEITRIPHKMQGTAIGLVMAGLMSLAFFAFKA